MSRALAQVTAHAAVMVKTRSLNTLRIGPAIVLPTYLGSRDTVSDPARRASVKLAFFFSSTRAIPPGGNIDGPTDMTLWNRESGTWVATYVDRARRRCRVRDAVLGPGVCLC